MHGGAAARLRASVSGAGVPEARYLPRLRVARAPARGTAGWTAAFLLGVYVLTTGGAPFVSDGEVMLLTAIHLVDRRTIALGQDAAEYGQTVMRADGAVFSRYGLGQPLVAAPLYGAGWYVAGRLLRVGTS